MLYPKFSFVGSVTKIALASALTFALSGCKVEGIPDVPAVDIQISFDGYVAPRHLNLEISGSGSIADDIGEISCDEDCSTELEKDTQVTLTAQPDSGFEFQQWTGACSGSNECVVTLDQDKTVAAIFITSESETQEYVLSTTVTGFGSVISDPAGLECSNECEANFKENTLVSLIVTPQAGHVFEGWSGACNGSSSCQIKMTENNFITANFAPITPSEYQLHVSVNGMGSVISSPSGINCGDDCEQNHSEDSQIVLTASPMEGYRFERWSGDCEANANCSFSINSNMNVTAIFVEDNANQSDIKIADYRPNGDAFQLGEISGNASGITWHEDLQQYLVVQNNTATLFRYDHNFAYLGRVKISSIPKDTEGLSYVGGNEVVVVNEANYAHKVKISEFVTNVDGGYDVSQGYRILPPAVSNKGLEGTAVRKASSGKAARIYACQEGTATNNSAAMKVVYFDMPTDTMQLMSYDDNLAVIEPFDAEQVFAGIVTDISGMVFDDRTGDLVIVSQESRKAIQVDPQTGSVKSQLALSGAPQFEGVTLGPNGEMVFVSEGNWIRIYEQQ